MANSDKNLVITPNISSSTGEPTITFSGADPSSGPQSLQARIYPTSNGTLSFEGSAGQLFSITNSLTGTLFSVNDVSGLPSIEVLDTGVVRLARYGGRVLIGNVVDNGNDVFQFANNTSVTFGSITSNTFTSLSGFSGSGALLTNLNAANVSTGTLANARTTGASANGANTLVLRDANGSFAANVITAATFIGPLTGDGTSLTNINASNVTSGTLSNARTSGSSANGANTLVLRDANGDFTSRVVTATLAGNIFANGPTISATDGNFAVKQSVSGWILSNNHPIVQWNFNVPYDDNLALSSGGNTAPNNQTSLIVSEVGGIIFGKSNTTPTTNTVLSTEWGRANSSGIFLSVGAFTGSGSGLTSLNATNLSSGTVPGARGVTAGSGSASFVAYNGTTSTSGQFDGGSTTPSGTTRLNYSGNFYAANVNITGTADTSTAASHYIVETGSDGFIRPKTLANAQAEIVTAATVNAVAQIAGSATSSVVRYGGTTAVAGQFDGGTTAPSGTTRLNYGGYLYATRFYGDGSNLTSIPNSATTASSSNGASTIVARDGAGSFTTNGITFNNLYNAAGATANTPNIWTTMQYNGTATPTISIAGATPALSSISLSLWNTSGSTKNTLSFARSKGASVGTYGAVVDNDTLGTIDFQGDDGNSFSPSSTIVAQSTRVIADAIVPGEVQIRTVKPTGGAPTVAFYVNEFQHAGVGITASTSNKFVVGGNVGLNGSYSRAGFTASSQSANQVLTRGVLQRDITQTYSCLHHWFYSEDELFTTNVVNFNSTQIAGKGDRHTIGNLRSFYSPNFNSVGWAGTYSFGFQGDVNAPNPGSMAQVAISSVSVTSNVVTVTTSTNHNYQTGQIVTIASTPINATSMVAGVEYSIASVGTTDFTTVGAPTQAVFTGSISGTTLTVTGMTSGTILVGCTLLGSGMTANTQIVSAGTGWGGPGTYVLNNSHTLGPITITALYPGAKFVATGPAASGDGTVRLQLDGSGISITNTGVSTFTYPRTTANVGVTTVAGSVTPARFWNLYMAGSANNYLAGNTGIGAGLDTPDTILHVRGNAIKVDTAANRDAILLTGRSAGTGGFAVTLVPATLSASRTLTLPDVTGNVVTTGDTGTVTNTMLAGSIATSKITGLAASATTDTTSATNITTGTLANARTSAASANGASTIVARDAGGSFVANTINLNGNLSVGTLTPETRFHFVSTTSSSTDRRIIFDNTSTTNFAGPWIQLRRTSSTNATSSLWTTGTIDFTSHTSNGQTYIQSTITSYGDNSNTVQSGNLRLAGRSRLELYTGSPSTERVRITDTGNVGIGTTLPASRLVVNKNSTIGALPTPPANTNFEVHGEDGAPNRIVYYSYGGAGGAENAPTFIFRRTNGTPNVPIAVSNDDAIGVIGAQGYDGSAWTLNRSAMFFYAANTWTSNSTPTRIQFSTTPNGSNTSSVRFTISDSGNVGINVVSPVARLDVSGNQAMNIVSVAALDIDCSSGNFFTKTINGASTFTFSNVPASRAYGFTLELTHTSGAVTWPAAVRWPANTAPTLTTGKTHLFVFITDDGGSRWRGSSLVDYDN